MKPNKRSRQELEKRAKKEQKRKSKSKRKALKIERRSTSLKALPPAAWRDHKGRYREGHPGAGKGKHRPDITREKISNTKMDYEFTATHKRHLKKAKRSFWNTIKGLLKKEKIATTTPYVNIQDMER